MWGLASAFETNRQASVLFALRLNAKADHVRFKNIEIDRRYPIPILTNNDYCPWIAS